MAKTFYARLALSFFSRVIFATVLNWGAPADGSTALVIAGGDLARVDMITGAVALVAGGIAPGYQCAGTRVATDVIFACEYGYGENVSKPPPSDPFGRWMAGLVISHTMNGHPVVEQGPQFGRFWVGDDGSIAMTSCWPPRRSHAGAKHVWAEGGRLSEPLYWRPCVRGIDGVWRSLTLDGGGSDRPRFDPVRWVPRADGDILAVVRGIDGVQSAWGSVDLANGVLHRWPSDRNEDDIHAALVAGLTPGRLYEPADDVGFSLDRNWTWTADGTLLGWGRVAGRLGAIEIRADGKPTPNRLAFDHLQYSGPVALGQTPDGQVRQTLDHGGTWSLAKGPPVDATSGWPPPTIPTDQQSACLRGAGCSLLGCELAGWLRIGWTKMASRLNR